MINFEVHPQPFALLRPVKTEPGPVKIYPKPTMAKIKSVFGAASKCETNAIDFETNGVDAFKTECYPVGVGIANSTGNYYFNLTELDSDTLDYLFEELTLLPNVIAHNAYFDGAWLYRETGFHFNWKACTYGLLRQLATEGFEGQRWSLKSAQLNLLGWTETNEVDLDDWLKANGYVNQNGNVLKGEMYRAPPEILGHYCGLDCLSTLQLYEQVLEPVLVQFPELVLHHSDDFLLLVKLLTEQYLRGIRIDVSALSNYNDELDYSVAKAKKDFLTHPDVAPFIQEWNIMKETEHFLKQPAKYKKVKQVAEPDRLTKSGQVSKNWEKWKARVDSGFYEPQVSKNWISWDDKYKALMNAQLFNMNSGDQLRWLLYEKLDFEVVLTTTSGLPATGGKALGAMGTIGSILAHHDKLVKEKSYVVAYLDQIYKGRLHPSWKVPGTLTGRLGGSTPNAQQIPKSFGVMSCFIPDPGNVLVDCDHKALEQVVLAELSNDRSLMKIYGPEAKPNDVYLFVGSQLPGIGDAIRDAGYDPDNPSISGIVAAKKKCKKERSIAKVVVLASSYGAGARKIHQTLTLSGIDVELEEVYAIHATYWKIFAGVKRYEKELMSEYNQPVGPGQSKSRGWVLNGIGRPIGVAADYVKDIVNRVTQSTGHDIHVKYVKHAHRLLEEAGVPWKPFIWDFHDQSILEVPAEFAELTSDILGRQAYIALNEEIAGSIPLAGDPMIINNLSECKLE